MLSLDLARKLRDAGLVWRLERGDMFHSEDADGIYVADGDRMMDLEGDLWLPRLDQLLAEIEARGYEYRQEYKKAYGLNDYHCLISEKGKDKYFGWGADTPEEAAGLALLHILGGGQDE